MADEDSGLEDKTEEATQERRDEFREQGQVAFSRDLTSVLALAGCVLYLTNWAHKTTSSLQKLFIQNFEDLSSRRIDQSNILDFAASYWKDYLQIILPFFLIVSFISIFSTLLQTKFNWSWQKTLPDWSRLNPIEGIKRIFDMQTAFELVKNIAKISVVSILALTILKSEWMKIPSLLSWTMQATWSYWTKTTLDLFWSNILLLIIIGSADYLYQFISYERRIRMTKQEVKEDYKRRELDPNIKGRMRRIQRENIMRNTVAKTKKATAVITNPTHYSVAIKYDLNDPAPIVIAKGEDEVALKMREVARIAKIPIIENRPLARALYAQVEEGEFIPKTFYSAVAEVIKYVFRLKGKKISSRRKHTPSIT